MSVAERLDEVIGDLEEALEQGVISLDEFAYLQSVSLDTDASCGGAQLIFMLKLAVPRMLGDPSKAHPVFWRSAKRAGVSLEESIADLPSYFTDRDLLRGMWRHLYLLDGLESHEAIVELCHQAAALLGIRLGFIPSCFIRSCAESQPAGLA